MSAAGETLPSELVWTSDGHLTEVGLSVFADGQTVLLSGDPLGHVDGCQACAARLGALAVRSLDVGMALRTRTAEALARRDGVRLVPRRRPMPLLAMAAALAIAAVAGLPGWGSGDGDTAESARALSAIEAAAPAVARAGMQAVRGEWEPSRGVVVSQWVVAGLLVVVGLVVAGRAGRRRSTQGGKE